MPIGALKNSLYRLALPYLGLRVQGHANSVSPMKESELHYLEAIFRRHHVVGGCLQLLKSGSLGSIMTYGFMRLPDEPVTEDTYFRAASITKMVTAVGAMVLQEKGMLDLAAPLEEYLPFPVRNPSFPDKPIQVMHLLSHTSGLWDGPGYVKTLYSPIPLSSLLKDPRNYLLTAPGEAFRYSNLAAGIIGSVMECAAKKSLEELMREMVFDPLSMKATYTLKNLPDVNDISCIYRVLPKGDGKPLFDPIKRLETADDFLVPSPEYHYLPAAGNLFIDAASLSKLVCMMASGGSPILSKASIQKMQTPAASYGDNAPYASHCLGIVALDNPALRTGRLYGHQGFAYGAAEGVFYEESTGNGFVFLNSGASEARDGHLAQVNRDLIHRVLDPAGGMKWM
jgi:CubicO group peptidase (beta-lactamase class C family)